MLTLPALAILTASTLALVVAVVAGWNRRDHRTVTSRAEALKVLGNATQQHRDAAELRRVPPHQSVRSGAVTILGPVDKPRHVSINPHSEPVVSPVAHLGRPQRVVDAALPPAHPAPVRPLSGPAEPTPQDPYSAQHSAVPDELVPDPVAILPLSAELPQSITSEPAQASSPAGRRVLAAAVSVAVVATGAMALGVWAPAPQPQAASDIAGVEHQRPSGSDLAAPHTPELPAPPSEDQPSPLATQPEGTGAESVRVQSPFTLNLAAGDPSWVRVATTGGSTLFEGTMEPGDTVQLRPAEPVDVHMGNPAGMLMGVDGRLVSHSRAEGQPVTVIVNTDSELSNS